MEQCIKKIKTMINIQSRPTTSSSINRFSPEHIKERCLLFSNFLFNLSKGILFDIPVYVLDIKFLLCSIDMLFLLKTSSESHKDIDKSFLIKIGYMHQEDKGMMSLIYHQGDYTQLSFENVMREKNIPLTKENETIVKLCLLNQFLINFKHYNPFDRLLLHPELMFYSNSKGIVYLDYIFSIIYQHFKEALSPIVLKYYGLFEGSNKEHGKTNSFLLLSNYYLMNYMLKGPKLSYESILQGFAIDYYYQDSASAEGAAAFDSLAKLYNGTKNSDPMIDFIVCSIAIDSFNHKHLLQCFTELYYKVLTKDIKCKSCLITSNQINHNKFVIHFPCFDIFCKNCLTNHKCIDLNFLHMVEAKKSDLLIHSIFVRNRHNKLSNSMFSGKYQKNQDAFLKSFKSRIDSDLIIALRKEDTFNNLTRIIFDDMIQASHDLKDSYKDLNDEVDADLLKKEAILSEWNCINDKLMSLANKYKLLGIHCKERRKAIKEELGTILVNFPSHLLNGLKMLRNRLVNQIMSVANIIKFKSSILDEFNPVNKYHTILSYVEPNSNIILSLNANRSKVDKPKILQIKLKEGFSHGFSYINMKTMLIITGGVQSSEAFCLYYPQNNSLETLNEDCFEMIPSMICSREGHAMISVKNFVFCIGGKSNSQWEYYDLFTERWTLMSTTLPKGYINSSLCLYNSVDLYLFLGYAFNDNENYYSAMDIVKTRLFESENPQWEIINYKRPKDFSTLVSFAIVPMTHNQILITGGLFHDKDSMANYSLYSYNLEHNVIKMEKRHPKWQNEKMLFNESCYYRTGERDYAIFASTKQIIHIKGR